MCEIRGGDFTFQKKIWVASPAMITEALDRQTTPVPNEDLWRLPLLEKLLLQRYEMETQVQDTTAIQELIDALCSS